MPLDVVLSTQAREDIKATVSYIASGNPDAAQRWRDRLEQRLRQLAEFPALGRDRSGLGTGLRSVPFGNRLIFYRARTAELEIVRLLHGAQDIESELTRRE